MALSPSDFNSTRLKKSGTVVAFFTAQWCPFCREFAPIFESTQEKDGITKAIVDLSDQENPLWETFEVGVVPTIIVFRDGLSVLRKDGVLGRGLPRDTMTRTMEAIRKIRT